ncbi:MAG: UDP-N-acetylmuramoyl-tripeptide--D-alanyl-D-alanine ligase [Tidjanibacter sp.]|nr:UDP-N-acetylmuramoyl-tripeptide--D-alanyl-D-alanine ligase [Tidjanibacter sp.]
MTIDNTITERLYGLFVQSEGVQTDSRKVRPGELFFALRGDNFDGNRYAAAAIEAGAVAAVVDNVDVVEPARAEKYVVVEDVLTALQELAHYHRKQLGTKVLAITGTNGKTTTKELVAAVLGRKFRTACTVGNLNNHIGVPLTLLSIGAEDEVAVVEMGASAQGEIARLAEIATPDLGLITNIGRAHLEGFGGVEGIRKGKGELYDNLALNGGTALYRKEDEVLSAMVTERCGLRAVGYSEQLAEGLQSNLVGDYNRFNIAAAVAVGRHFGVEEAQIGAAIAEYVPSNNRSQQVRTEANLLTVDCYNANPSSMAAAVAVHNATEHSGYHRKVLILGDMLELGEWSHEEHEKIVQAAVDGPADRIILVGKNFGGTTSKDSRIVRCATAEDVVWLLSEQPLRRAFVLIKGSRGVGLERVLGAL